MFDFEKKGLSSHSDLVWVCIFGALGGVLFWAICILHDGDFCNRDLIGAGTWLSLLLSVFLGAGSGAVFVFLIANTDRTDKARFLTLAFLSGISWEPVLIIALNAEDVQGRNTLLINDAKKDRSNVEETKSKISKIESSQPSLKEVNNQTEEGMESNETFQEEEQLVANLIELTTDLIDALAFPHANESISSLGPELPELKLLQPGEQEPSFSSQWHRLIINDEQKVTIEITAENADDDLIARLYRYNEGTEKLESFDFDDDSGGNNNPKLEVNLPGGKYFLHVSHFVEEDKPLNFSVAYNSSIKDVQGSPADDGSQ